MFLKSIWGVTLKILILFSQSLFNWASPTQYSCSVFQYIQGCYSSQVICGLYTGPRFSISLSILNFKSSSYSPIMSRNLKVTEWGKRVIQISFFGIIEVNLVNNTLTPIALGPISDINWFIKVYQLCFPVHMQPRRHFTELSHRVGIFANLEEVGGSRRYVIFWNIQMLYGYFTGNDYFEGFRPTQYGWWASYEL